MSAPHQPLAELAAALERRGLRAPAALLLDAVRPLDFVNSQIARFSLPLLGGTAAEPFAVALAETEAWRELRRLLDDPTTYAG